ncbi:DUF4358 domain-containing protein [Peribacillus loiseleuriae]|uniref:DUF4358 domain-containing protein n=1 Tax=Peribacillus loiseleuriae TaxID=1679170 RepID=A0A0K9GPQ8_9BACI|nr:DUF4358 domain-containing protein [Peribacillus loiseleuriae]KMY48679.1 hypothetical protein AC625_03450 [Peribacillus loiseleuriae]
MKKRMMVFMFTLVLGMVITGCSKDKSDAIEAKMPAKEMAEKMVKEVEEPALIELQPDEVKEIYNLDPEKLDEYSIRIPLMSVKTNEIAILKVKDAKDVPDVESAVKQRVENVKKQFEHYLPDQYENAKNYKLVTKGNYVLLVISEKADELVKVYDSFFDQK